MTRLFTPVQRLMGRLRYTSKFLLMSAVFGLPLLYLASGVLLHQYAALQDAQRLQDSVAQLRGMTHLTQGVERLRNLSMLRLGLPDLTHMPIYAEQLVQVDRQLEQFRLQQPERSLLIDRLRDDIARGSNRLYSEGTRPETVFDNAHMPVEQILGWRYELINRSGLLNRPPAGLEQAASILFNTLPSLQRRAGAVQAFGSYFLMHGHLDSSSTYMLNQAWQQLDDEIRQMQAMAQEQSGYARRLLDTVIGEARAIQDLFDAQLIQVFELNTPWEAYDAAAQAHLTRIQGAVDATLGELDARLREDYQARLWYLIGHGCGIVLISLLAVYLFVGFYLNVRSTVTGLRDAAERVAQGDYTTPVTTQTQDELARLAHALDDMRLELQRREDMLRDFSLRDGLTGLRNRACFDEALGSLMDAAARHGTDLALLLIDLDHFKQVNDTYGHQAGDAVLRQTAERFHAVFQRKTDVVARYGGEEFAIILADVGEARARQLAEQVRQQIAATPMDLGHQAIDVTASIGLAWCRPTSQYTAHDLVADADMALYEAKRLGRNRVCLHHTLCESGA